VEPDWIDYNGHMNVAYYTLAFDRALDQVYDLLGIGPALVESHRMGPMALQSQIFYLAEMLEGEPFVADFQLLDWDAKRIHSVSRLVALRDGGERLAATYETLSINVDLETRRTAPYPADRLARIEALGRAQAGLERPEQVGRPIGIRRKG
jgi:acyl-CoA thioester hydrolase